jgi:16S rRNA G1207 methylase RsmC
MAWRALRPGGRLWLVGKNNELMARRTEEAFGNLEILRRRGYSIVTAIRQDTRRYS